MCVVSAVGDNFSKRVPNAYPWYPGVEHPFPPSTPLPDPSPTREEFNKLKRDIEELKILLKAAKRFDEETGQPDCHTDEKVDLIKRLAELVGVDLEEVFG